MKIKLNRDQMRRIENACIRHDGPAVAAIATSELGRPVLRCQKCQQTDWLYPHIIHMEKEHGVTNYFKTLHNLHSTAP